MGRVVSVSQPLLFVSVCAVGLSACGGLNHQKIAESIQQDITTNGGTSVKSVTCPRGIEPEAGKSFECVGAMDNGYTFTITVQQKDTNGNVTWDVPHAKGLVHIPKLESAIQTALETEIGVRPSIACGGIYKAVKPGEGFECRIVYKTTKAPAKPKNASKGKPTKPAPVIQVTQTEKVNVTTDSDGNITWQRIPPNLAKTTAMANGS
ncbi:MAG: DUF4333 domain-containing protein [Oscillatoriales cyanobacterium C42_A2020_001]|nr:DUF4333 domain-containing protein [Leptolyngbyaceae cyanobacterium C42_A2020_001]